MSFFYKTLDTEPKTQYEHKPAVKTQYERKPAAKTSILSASDNKRKPAVDQKSRSVLNFNCETTKYEKPKGKGSAKRDIKPTNQSMLTFAPKK